MSRRDQILDAVVDLFKDKGFRSDFTMVEIANTVNIGKSTIYEYFKNKDEILKEAVYRYMEQNIKILSERTTNENDSFEDAFKSEIRNVLGIASKSKTIIQTVSPNFMHNVPEEIRGEFKLKMEELRQTLTKRFTGYFQRGLQEGVFTGELNLEKAFIITSMVAGSILIFDSESSQFSIDQTVDLLYSNVIRTINEQ